MVRIKISVCFILLITGFTQAQNRYMVFFNDKVGTPHDINSPETFLSSRAIDRRANQSIAIVEEDLPVVPSYIESVRNASPTVKVLYRTKWMNGVLVECTTGDVTTLQALPKVSAVEYVAPGPRPTPSGRIRSSKKFKEATEGNAATDTQLSMIGIDVMHEEGYHGEGILMAIMDAGFPGADTISYFKHVFNEGRFDAATSYDFVSGGSNVFRHNNHGTHVWSTIAAFKTDFTGGAYKANYILFVTEHAPTEYRVEEYNWLFAAEKADSAGVDVITTSLGYTTFDDPSMNNDPSELDGQTTVITRAAEMAASKGIAVVASAGNAGQGSPTTIGAPSDGENVLAIGAVTTAGTITSFSSIGPSADGRIKPDVVALGAPVAVIGTNGAISSSTGTSFSAPLTASLVAGVWQKLPDLSAKELFNTIRNSASRASSPNNRLGYGIPNFMSVITATETEMSGDWFVVFPNPTTNQVRVEFKSNVSLEQMKFDILDSKGSSNSVDVVSLSEKQLLIDISSFKPGIYLLRCQRGKQYLTHKILKTE